MTPWQQNTPNCTLHDEKRLAERTPVVHGIISTSITPTITHHTSGCTNTAGKDKHFGYLPSFNLKESRGGKPCLLLVRSNHNLDNVCTEEELFITDLLTTIG